MALFLLVSDEYCTVLQWEIGRWHSCHRNFQGRPESYRASLVIIRDSIVFLWVLIDGKRQLSMVSFLSSSSLASPSISSSSLVPMMILVGCRHPTRSVRVIVGIGLGSESDDKCDPLVQGQNAPKQTWLVCHQYIASYQDLNPESCRQNEAFVASSPTPSAFPDVIGTTKLILDLLVQHLHW